MSRKGGEHEFGSDSFLDVIANVVGILIILIVMAGVRVSKAPVTEQEIAAFAPHAVPAPSPPSADEPPAEAVAVAAEPEPVRAPLAPVEAPALEPPPPAEPSPELVSQADELSRRLAALKAEAAKSNRGAGDVPSAAAVQRQLAEINAKLKQAGDDKQARKQTAAQLQASISEVAGKLAAARRQLEALEKARPPAQEIKHSVTPVSRAVVGQELHFHLSGGRVAFVPLEDLVGRLRTQVARQREWLSKFRRHQGEVGPVGGFRMKFVVEREESSVMDELRQGAGMMRIGVSQWQVIPEPDLEGETAAKALRAGSAFQRALRQASVNTTLTFWVYPDSFGLYRDLTEFAHKEGYTVAARPLPVGLFIAGSPQGTRSAGQ